MLVYLRKSAYQIQDAGLRAMLNRYANDGTPGTVTHSVSVAPAVLDADGVSEDL